MSIRAQLLARVARCALQQTQHATFEASDATGYATTPQQTAKNPHKHWVSSATSDATAPQQGHERGATFGESCELRFLSGATRNTPMLPSDLSRLLGLLDHVGGLDLKGIAVAMGEPISNVIRWIEQAKRRRLVMRSGQWWNLTRQAYQLSVERLEPTGRTSDPEEREEADRVQADVTEDKLVSAMFGAEPHTGRYQTGQPPAHPMALSP